MTISSCTSITLNPSTLASLTSAVTSVILCLIAIVAMITSGTLLFNFDRHIFDIGIKFNYM
jgi:hypothetical protein